MAARVAAAAAGSAGRVAVGNTSRNPRFLCELLHLSGHACEQAKFTCNKLNIIQVFGLEVGFRM